MSMFYFVEASGILKNGKLVNGLTSYSEPEHMDHAAIIDWCNEVAKSGESYDEPNLDKASCPEVQVLEKWDSYGARGYSLLVKAMGYGQADERARKFGKTLAPDYFRKQEAEKNYQNRVKNFIKEGRELFGDNAVFSTGRRR